LKLILYTKNFNEKINSKVDVILSPQFYWIKKIDIPIKSLKDAKKLSKSLFKLDENYIFDAFYLDGKYFAYAIKKDLNLKIPKKYINSIRLAQIELYDYDSIKIPPHYCIKKINDLLFCFPFENEGEEITEVLSNIKLSNYKVNSHKTNMDKEFLILIFLIFFLFNAAVFLQTLKNNDTVIVLENKKNSLIKTYNLPSTTFEMDSIISDLKTRYQKEVKLKKDLEFITHIPLRKDEKAIYLSFTNNKYKIKIDSKRNLDFYFKKKFKVISKTSPYEADLYE